MNWCSLHDLKSLFPSLIAAFVAFFTLFITLGINKENKITDYRRDWITEFSKEVSLFLKSYLERNRNLKKTTQLLQEFHLIAQNSSDSYEKLSVRQIELEDIRKTLRARTMDATNELYRTEASLRLILSGSGFIDKEVRNEFMQLINKTGKVEMSTDEESISLSICNYAEEIISSQWKEIKRGGISYRIFKRFFYNFLSPL